MDPGVSFFPTCPETTPGLVFHLLPSHLHFLVWSGSVHLFEPLLSYLFSFIIPALTVLFFDLDFCEAPMIPFSIIGLLHVLHMMGSWEMGFKAYGIDVFSFLFFSLFLLLYEVCTKYPKARAFTPSDILKTFAVPIPLFYRW